MDDVPRVEGWFYVHGGLRHGPLSLDALLDRILSGQVPGTVSVWRAGLERWQPAEDVEEIRCELPPPLPGAGGAGNVPALEDSTLGAPAEPSSGGSDAHKARRKRRSREARNRGVNTTWLAVVAAALVVLAALVWLLLVSLNSVPEGRVIE